jgi:hypothetical protein
MIASSWGKVTEKYEWREGSHDGEVRAWIWHCCGSFF